MSKDIGKIIRELRIQKSMTQEELAELVLVTPQAISKWERGVGYPDITQIVPLANIFDVSIDELFDHQMNMQETDINEYIEKYNKLKNQGVVKEALALWQEANQKYPKNYKCQRYLAAALFNTLNSCSLYSYEERCENARQVIDICKKIMDECTDNAIRNQTLQILVLTLSRSDLSTENEEEAVKYANMGSSFYVSREKLFEHAWFTDENKHNAITQKHFNNLSFMDNICMNICHTEYKTVEDKIFANETALKLWNTLLYDDNVLFYSCRLSKIYINIAQCYANLKNKDKVIENLYFAKKYAKKHDDQKDGDQYYTSIFVSHASCNKAKTAKNYTQREIDIFVEELSNKCYDFIRETEEFKKII